MSSRLPFRPIVALVGFTAALAGPALAGVGVWTPFGPNGAFVRTFAASPAQPGLVLAGTVGGGAFRSTDGGRSWTPSSAGLSVKVFLASVAAFEFDPFQAQTAFAATLDNGVYRSTDGGRSWSPGGPGLPPPSSSLGSTVTSLRADPFNAGVLFAGTERGVFRSLDRGASWAARRTGLPDLPVSALGFDPTGRILYAGVAGSGVYKSSNRGGRWQPANAGLPLSVYSLGFDPKSPSVVFAGTSNGLYRSLDRGQSWARVGANLIRTVVRDVGFLATTGALFAGTGEGVFESLDRGTTWRQVFAVPGTPSLQAFTVGPQTLFLATFRYGRTPDLLRSSDGARWEDASRGLAAFAATAFAADPVSPSTAYAVLDVIGLYKTTDRGATWRRLPLEFSTFHLGEIAVDPLHPETVFAAAPIDGPLVRSDDGGATWRRSTNAPFHTAEALALDPRRPGALWLGGLEGAAYTPDGGSSFTLVLPEGERPWVQDVEVDPLLPATVYLAGTLSPEPTPNAQPRLYRSLDGGSTWSRLPLEAGMGTTFRHVAVDPGEPGALYAASDLALFRTEDDGLHWRRLFEFGGLPGYLAFSSGRLYASNWLTGIKVSRDRGATWTPLRAGLGARRVTGLWLDPHDPNHLFAGTENGGLYEYTEAP